MAIIMDGNGRWATRRGLPRIMGHRAGMEALHRVVSLSGELGLKVLTVYAFSTENWKRPPDEVTFLWRLLEEYVARELESLLAQGVCLRGSGDLTGLPQGARAALERGIEATRNCQGLCLNLALNYGGRWDVVQAVKKLVVLAAEGRLQVDEVNESLLDRQLVTAEIPDPDLLIRPAGEMRISNFLLWQLAYTELWFCPTLWPDFGERELLEALLSYQDRERRYGGL